MRLSKCFKSLFFAVVVLASLTSGAQSGPADLDAFADLKNPDYKNIQGAYQTGDDYSIKFPNEIQGDEDLGFSQTHSSQTRHIRRTDSKIIYDAIYSFDEFGRRVAPVESPGARNRFVVLSGCSFTYGNGLNDNETLNYFLAKELPQYFPYNYGIGGTAVNTSLAIIQSGRLQKEIPQSRGVFVYVFIGSHIDRTAGLNPNLQWLARTPYFEEREGETIRNGSWLTARPYYVLVMSWFQKLFSWIGNPWVIFPPVNDGHVEYVCKLMAQSQKDLLRQFPDSKYMVYFHPGATGDVQKLSQCLDQKGVKHFPGAKLDPNLNYYIEGDGHPNELTNRVIAKDLAAIITDLESK